MNYINSHATQTPHEKVSPEATPQKDTTLSLNNQTLMRGTPFTEKTFDGMTPLAINKFLNNWYAGRESQDKEKEGTASNTPIVGTPVGSGKPKMPIDDFMTMDPKLKKINFEAPASVVFAKVKNKEEAKNRWVQP